MFLVKICLERQLPQDPMVKMIFSKSKNFYGILDFLKTKMDFIEKGYSWKFV